MSGTSNVHEKSAKNIPETSSDRHELEQFLQGALTCGDKNDKEVVREKKFENKIKKKEKLKKQMTEERSRNEVRLAVQSDNDDEDNDNEESDGDDGSYDDDSDDICND